MEQIKKDKIENSYIFVDLSNITVGFYNYKHNKHQNDINNSNLNYKSFFSLIEKNKNIKRKMLVGSKRNDESNDKRKKKQIHNEQEFKQNGYEVHILERINNKEKGVDEVLHLNIIQTILCKCPGYITICTGDGRSSDYTKHSIYDICIKALEFGWKVTIVSWRNQLNKKYIQGPELNNILKNSTIKSNYNLLYLDDFVDQIIN